MSTVLTQGDGGVYLNIHAVSGAKRAGVQGFHGDALKVAIMALAQKGQANKELIGILAKELNLKRQELRLCSGLSSRSKKVFIVGLDIKTVKSKLDKLDLS